MNNAILLSGGMDSIALAYWKRPKIAFTINYGQAPAATEIRSSAAVAKMLDIEHHIIEIDCGKLGSGDLNNTKPIEIAPSIEWWPYRNQLLVTFALMKGIQLSVKEIMVATVKSDGFHRDGTPEFYQCLHSLSSYQEGHIQVSAPAIDLTTAELVREAGVPREVLLWSHSCHRSNIACCQCRGCLKYALVMNELFYA